MGRVVTRTEFFADSYGQFRVDVEGVERFGDYSWETLVSFAEIPEFIAWLQAEYDKQKAES